MVNIYHAGFFTSDGKAGVSYKYIYDERMAGPGTIQAAAGKTERGYKMKKMSGEELETISGGSCDLPPKYNCGQDVKVRLKGQDYVGTIWEIGMHNIYDIWVYHIKGNDFEFEKVPENCIRGLA